MAVRDVEKYYVEIEQQYFEMLDDIKDMEKAVVDGEMSEEQYQQAVDMIDIIKVNYERLSYIMFLLKKRKKHLKKAKQVRAEIDENKKALDTIKSLKEAN